MLSKLFISVLVSLMFLGTEKEPSPKQKKKGPPNIILMIGDGMGHAQLSSAIYYGPEKPQYLRFPIVGLSITSSSSHKITDSAAGATAFSCGVKTYNGAIGMAQDSTALPTILEDLAQEGWKTGLIATSSITHATPASFFAHVPLRKQEFEIAEQFLTAPVDFAAGGGKRFFFDRLDEQNLYPKFAENNIVIDTTKLEAKDWQSESRYAYFLAQDGLPPVKEGRGDFLPRSTEMALDCLSSTEGDKPFFLMVEGSQIDWGGHANDGDYLTSEMIDFDKAIGKALDFAAADGNTIVIVTADHECGGFAMVSTKVEVPFQGKRRDYDSLSYSFGSGGHSSTMVPVLAYGPGAETFTGIYDNHQIYHKLKAILAKTK